MIKQFVLIAIKYMAPFFMLLIPLVMVYGLMFPWPPSSETLSKYENSIALLSGFKSTYKNDYEKHSKTYLIIKTEPLSSLAVKITIDSNGLYEVKEHNGGIIIMLFSYIFLCLVTWWFWFKKDNSHNKAIQLGRKKRAG